VVDTEASKVKRSGLANRETKKQGGERLSAVAEEAGEQEVTMLRLAEEEIQRRRGERSCVGMEAGG
jgi:hypothetical protein